MSVSEKNWNSPVKGTFKEINFIDSWIIIKGKLQTLFYTLYTLKQNYNQIKKNYQKRQ